MGVIVNKERDDNVELTEKINADLRRKMATVQNVEGDEAETEEFDSEYLKQFEKTGRFSWVWFVLIGLAVASLVFIVLL